jgi:hypothetical protein
LASSRNLCSIVSPSREIAMHALLLMLLQASGPAISSEAELLGVRLARTSGLAAIAPALIEKDLAELAREDASLSAAERERLLSIGRTEARAGLEKVMQAMGSGYARRLSVEDLRILVAHGESPVAVRGRTAEPSVIAGAMGTLGEMDLKKNVAAAFCRDSGKLCDRK